MKLDKEILNIIIAFYRNLLKCENEDDIRCVLSSLETSIKQSLSNITIACHKEDFDKFKYIAGRLGFTNIYKPLTHVLEFDKTTYIICYNPVNGTYGTFIDYKDLSVIVRSSEWFIYNYNHIANIIVGTNKAINE